MSIGGSSSSGGGLQQDPQINIASIIDCFTVLITYILAAASFLSIGALDAGVAGAGAPSAQVSGSVAAAQVPSLHIHVEEGDHLSMSLGVGEQKSDLNLQIADLTEKVGGFKSSHPTLKTVTLSAADKVPYLSLVNVVSSLKQLGLSVVFSGTPGNGIGG